MKVQPATLMPLILVGLLTALTYWLYRTTESAEQAQKAAARHDPDFIVENFSVQRFDETGVMVNSVAADKMTHYPDDSSSDLINPEMHFYLSATPSKLTALGGRLINDGKEVHLQGDVRLFRPAGTAPAVLIRSETLTVFPDTDYAITKSPVVITQNRSIVHGSGLEYHGKEQVAVLFGRVNGTFIKKVDNP